MLKGDIMGRAYEAQSGDGENRRPQRKEYARFGAIIYKAAKSGIPTGIKPSPEKEIERAKKPIFRPILLKGRSRKESGAAEDYHTVNFEFGPATRDHRRVPNR